MFAIVRSYMFLISAMTVLLAQSAPAQSAPAPASRMASSQPSLGEYARGIREKKRAKVKVTPEEAQQIFKAVDDIASFASQDSGLRQKSSIKRQLVGQSEVERLVREQTTSEEEKQERQRGLLAMKKFGLLPRDFDMEAFAAELMGESVAGFYDPKTKVVSLLDWVPLEEQKTVLAHELVHALQDQNYDLQKWHKQCKAAITDPTKSVVNSETDQGESSVAGRSVTEGQAMVVMLDYLLAPIGRNLEHSPGLVEPLQQHMSYIPEGPVLHRAPLVIHEGMAFPYREGTLFEIALLQQGGRDLAFTSALQHPPRLTHEILHPETYLGHQKIAPLRIPDLRPILGESARVQDSGVIGELDTRILIHQFESKWLAKQLAKAWRGGSYVTVARSPEVQPTTTNDVALLYISRWQSPDAAERFAKFYAGAVAKRYRQAAVAAGWKPVAGKLGQPIWSIQIATEEGPVMVEQWPGNLVIVTEGFDAGTSVRLRDTVLSPAPSVPAAVAQSDLTLRLASSPELAGLRDAVHANAIGTIVRLSQEAAKH